MNLRRVATLLRALADELDGHDAIVAIVPAPPTPTTPSPPRPRRRRPTARPPVPAPPSDLDRQRARADLRHMGYRLRRGQP